MLKRSHLLFFVATTFLFISLFTIFTPDSRAQGEAYTLRIGITADGIYRIGYDDLRSAGIDPATIDPRQLAMTSQKKPIAIEVIGGDDGNFGQEDSIIFFGQKFHGSIQDEKYTDENIYWLHPAERVGRRITTIDATPAETLEPPKSFTTTIHAEENRYWYTQYKMDPPQKTTWFWSYLRPIKAGATVSDTLPTMIPYPIREGRFTLTLTEIARTQSQKAEPDHRTTLALNGKQVLQEDWEGKHWQTFTTTIPATLTTHGINTVTVFATNLPDITSDQLYVDDWELTYQRQFRAWQGQIDFSTETPGPHTYEIDGWENSDITIFDITDPLSPRHLTNYRASDDEGDWTIRFGIEDKVHDHFWLQENDTFSSPASITLYNPPDLRTPSTGADVIIVTSPELQPAAQRLAAWHKQRGLNSHVVLFQDLINEFNDGIYHPRAITNFMAWTQTHWPAPIPKYLILFGDGHWNFKGFNTDLYPMDPQQVPPYLAWVDPWQGEVPADNRYADIDDDGNPDIIVGRIPVGNLEQAQAVIDKLVSYRTGYRKQDWQRRALFVADRTDPVAGDFISFTDKIIEAYLPPDLTVQRIFLGAPYKDGTAMVAAITRAINQGVWMIQYMGHGSPNTWTKEQSWSLKAIKNLHNAGRYPMVFTFNCLDGYFAYPGYPSITETMLRQSQAGSIAAISPTGLGTTNAQHEFRKLLMDELFQNHASTIGEAMFKAKQQYYKYYGRHYLIETDTLFGDPTLPIPQEMPEGLTNFVYTPLFLRAPSHP